MKALGVRPLACRAAAAIALLASSPTQSRSWHDIQPEETAKTITVADEGVTVTVVLPPNPANLFDLSGEEIRAAYADAEVTVNFPELPPLVLPSNPGREGHWGIGVGIAKLNRADADPAVFVAGYTGGAHCCATLQIVSLVDGRPVVATLPRRDGDPMSELPADIDGDGTVELLWSDPSLLHVFASYAESWSVPRIYAIRDGKAVDVSREPRFGAIYRAFNDKTLKACRTQDHGRKASCAAYAYGMVIAGRAEEGIRTAVQSAEDTDEFEADLRQLMQRHGYLP